MAEIHSSPVLCRDLSDEHLMAAIRHNVEVQKRNRFQSTQSTAARYENRMLFAEAQRRELPLVRL